MYCYSMLNHFAALLFLYFLFGFVFDFEDTFSLGSPDCPLCRDVDHAGLQLGVPPDSGS